MTTLPRCSRPALLIGLLLAACGDPTPTGSGTSSGTGADFAGPTPAGNTSPAVVSDATAPTALFSADEGEDDDEKGDRDDRDNDEREFVPRSDNPYFPLVPGTRYRYRSRTSEGIETEVFTVTFDTKRITGVTTRVIEDVVRLNGSIIEHTFDWFAQDTRSGAVYYFGEDSRQFENGKLVGTEGSWQAGRHGARAGKIMEGHPKVGDSYREEFAPGVAEDRARVLSLDARVHSPFGNFHGCLKTENFTRLDPGLREHKFYCRGVGLVREVAVVGPAEDNRLVSIRRP